MATALAPEKPPLGQKMLWAGSRLENRPLSRRMHREKCRPLLRLASGAPVFANGAVTAAMAFAFNHCTTPGNCDSEAARRGGELLPGWDVGVCTIEGGCTGTDWVIAGFGVIPSGGKVFGSIAKLFKSLRGVTRGADNIATAPKLADDLRLQSARSPFTAGGGLTDDAIRGADEIIPASRIGDPNIPAGFSKFSTQTFQSPSGDFQVRFLKNPQTGEVLFNNSNYKTIFNRASGQ